ncbi:carboxypeptidase-like regulatory domain-containing protein [Gynurincola endophyticus]|jgi:hypothetical protein|uniref:carboxypeptidase-like regulatory domain-containing protein n=1 Tax=Gynurincola endophyticus TaxID=2479004 RepID=UPI000F8CED44|nr:carboxypeptidase-like regulatory domain-containing protein [Gynurincola endophyticus]
MKQIKMSIAAIVILAGSLLAFKAQNSGSIKGSVSPTDAGVKVWAISATDTLQSAISNGLFELRDVKEGSYRVIIEATPPYKNAAKDNVSVTAGNVTDVGTITLSE